MREPEVRRLTSSVGATIDAVDLREPLQAQMIQFIRQTLLDNGVVFFRNQDATVEELWAFLRNFGTPQKEDSFGTDADRPEDVQDADFQPTKHGTAVWHTDSSFLEKPPKFTLLRAVRTARIVYSSTTR